MSDDGHNLANLREDYLRRTLDEADVARDPFTQFGAWFADAVAAELREPNAMTLATATPGGRPSARMVLLKGFDTAGFVFYTNAESRKGVELAANPYAALVFFWNELERQVRVEGRVEPVSPAESDAYFASRPRGSQLGSAASDQSRVIPSRETLEQHVAELEARYPSGNVPRPPHWGGYRVIPDVIEFWQGRPSRLHDRLRYTRQPNDSWHIDRLAP